MTVSTVSQHGCTEHHSSAADLTDSTRQDGKKGRRKVVQPDDKMHSGLSTKFRAGTADKVTNKEFPEVNIAGKRVSPLEAEHWRVEVKMTCAPLSWNVLLLGH